MFSAYEFMVALRYLRARRREGFVSIIAAFSFLGIVLGVGTLIVVMAVMNGFPKALMERVLGINAHISVSVIGGPVTQYQTLTEKILTIPGVTKAAPLIQGQVLATSNDQHVGAMIRGMRKDDLKLKSLVSSNIKIGSLEDFPSGVIIGIRMAESMGLFPGDTIRLISPSTTETILGSMPRLKDYPIVGVFDVGMYEYDSTTIFMPLAQAQTYFRLPKSTTSIEVEVEEGHDISTIVNAIKQQSGNLHIVDWREANKQFLNTLKVERVVMFFILTLIVAIAGFNIISGMVILVKSKGKEVAILRTMGATRGAVMRIFFMTGATIGVVGTAVGAVIGALFADNIEAIRRWLESLTGVELFNPLVYYLSKLPADLQAGDVVNVVIMALIISFIAPLYPAWRAARLQPVEGLRYE